MHDAESQGVPHHAISVALLFFNLGVEIGQLVFVAAVMNITAQLVLHIERHGSDERVAGCGRPSGSTICVLSRLCPELGDQEACRDGAWHGWL